MRLSDAEWRIMTVLWERRSATAREVYETLQEGSGWEYSTVRTMIKRLVDKGALLEVDKRYANEFEPLVEHDESVHAEIESLADRAFGGTLAPLAQFLVGATKFSKAERDKLLTALREIERDENKEE
jgi:BlaI family transcriptional regulator, penicillinase repressor